MIDLLVIKMFIFVVVMMMSF